MSRQDAIKHWRFLIVPGNLYNPPLRALNARMGETMSSDPRIRVALEDSAVESNPLNRILPDANCGRWSKHEELFENTEGKKVANTSRKTKLLQSLKNLAFYKKP